MLLVLDFGGALAADNKAMQADIGLVKWIMEELGTAATALRPD